MNKWIGTAVVIATVSVCGCSRPAPDQQMLVDVAEALGGEQPLREARTLVLKGRGRFYRVGQSKSDDAKTPYYEVSDYTHTVDLVNQRMRTEIVRSTAFYTSSPALDERLVSGLDGGVAFNVNNKGEQQRTDDQVARERRAEMYHHPLPLIRLALTEGSGATVGEVRPEEEHDAVDIKTAAGQTFTLHINRQTKLPTKITSRSYHSNLGDVTISTEFEDYGQSDRVEGSQVQLNLPRTIKSRMDRRPIADWYVASRIDGESTDLAASDAVKAAAPPVAQVRVDVKEMAPGVWALTGQSHNSVVVEFPKYSVLIEAPQHDRRALAVIAKARELVPNKPLQYVVNTHHHFDHSGGVRAAVAEGLTIITHENNRAFFEEITKRPHTIEKDHLAQSARPLKIETVKGDEMYALRDGGRVLEIHRVTGDAHVDDLLMAYLPRERIIVEADAFHPDTAEAPFAANLLANIQQRNLQVDRIIAVHGTVPATLRQLEDAARKFPARTGGGPANHPQEGMRAAAGN